MNVYVSVDMHTEYSVFVPICEYKECLGQKNCKRAFNKEGGLVLSASLMTFTGRWHRAQFICSADWKDKVTSE